MIVTGSGNLVPSIIPPTITLITPVPITVSTDEPTAVIDELLSSRIGKRLAFLYNVDAILISSLSMISKILSGKTALATSLVVRLLELSCVLKFNVSSIGVSKIV